MAYNFRNKLIFQTQYVSVFGKPPPDHTNKSATSLLHCKYGPHE